MDLNIGALFNQWWFCSVSVMLILIPFIHTMTHGAVSPNWFSLSFLYKLFKTVYTSKYLPLSLGLGVPKAGLGSFTNILEPAVRKKEW